MGGGFNQNHQATKHPRLGSPDDLKYLIDKLHEAVIASQKMGWDETWEGFIVSGRFGPPLFFFLTQKDGGNRGILRIKAFLPQKHVIFGGAHFLKMVET